MCKKVLTFRMDFESLKLHLEQKHLSWLPASTTHFLRFCHKPQSFDLSRSCLVNQQERRNPKELREDHE